jgi:PHD/YefM family antitoxin component YafN of YafNO toxin-antitoxin module
MSIADNLNPEFVVDSKGKRKAVILSFEEYEELLQDLSDLSVIAERREEDTISHEDLMKLIITE